MRADSDPEPEPDPEIDDEPPDWGPPGTGAVITEWPMTESYSVDYVHHLRHQAARMKDALELILDTAGSSSPNVDYPTLLARVVRIARGALGPDPVVDQDP